MTRLVISFLQILIVLTICLMVFVIWKGFYDGRGIFYIFLTFIVAFIPMAFMESMIRSLQKQMPLDDPKPKKAKEKKSKRIKAPVPKPAPQRKFAMPPTVTGAGKGAGTAVTVQSAQGAIEPSLQQLINEGQFSIEQEDRRR